MSSANEVNAVIEGMNATSDQVQRAEHFLRANPNDLYAHLLLLGFYSSKELAAQHERHALWVIEHCPSLDLVAWMCLSHGGPGYDVACRLWVRHLSSPSVSFQSVSNAVFFFRAGEPERAERILIDFESRFCACPEYWEHRISFYVGWLRTLELVAKRQRLLVEAMAAVERRLALAPQAGHLFFATAARVAAELGKYRRSRELANELLRSGLADPVEWRRSNALHFAHTVLGLVALRELGDLAAARVSLLASVGVAGSPQMAAGGVSFDLAMEVVSRGDTDAGIAFLHEVERLWTHRGGAVPVVRAALVLGDPSPFFRLATEHAEFGRSNDPEQ